MPVNGVIFMACNKCAQEAYNNAAQTYVAAGTPITILGTQVLNSGCSIATTAGGFTIRNGGIIRISYDVTSTPTAAGVQSVQLFKDGIALPCAIASDNVLATDGTITQHVETTLSIPTCCNIHPNITATISGTTGTVNHVCASAVKIG